MMGLFLQLGWRSVVGFTWKRGFITGILVLLLSGSCGSSASYPNRIMALSRELNQYPEFSIILMDMKEEGNFVSEYSHRYRYIYAPQSPSSADSSDPGSELKEGKTEWLRVSPELYNRYQEFLGMTILTKKSDGTLSWTQGPPGYEYVGNSRYGHWSQNNSGNRFWEFYGQYALLSALIGRGQPVYYNDWRGYDDSYRRGKPFFGRNNEYGTRGTLTRKTNPNFFQRRLQRERLRKESFAQKMRTRTTRSGMSGIRSRSSGFGK